MLECGAFAEKVFHRLLFIWVPSTAIIVGELDIQTPRVITYWSVFCENYDQSWYIFPATSKERFGALEAVLRPRLTRYSEWCHSFPFVFEFWRWCRMTLLNKYILKTDLSWSRSSARLFLYSDQIWIFPSRGFFFFDSTRLTKNTYKIFCSLISIEIPTSWNSDDWNLLYQRFTLPEVGASSPNEFPLRPLLHFEKFSFFLLSFACCCSPFHRYLRI